MGRKKQLVSGILTLKKEPKKMNKKKNPLGWETLSKSPSPHQLYFKEKGRGGGGESKQKGKELWKVKVLQEHRPSYKHPVQSSLDPGPAVGQEWHLPYLSIYFLPNATVIFYHTHSYHTLKQGTADNFLKTKSAHWFCTARELRMIFVFLNG